MEITVGARRITVEITVKHTVEITVEVTVEVTVKIMVEITVAITVEITVAITVKNYGRQLQWKIACVCSLAAGRESWTIESANQLLSKSGKSVFSFKN